MKNIFSDSSFINLLKNGYNIISYFPHPDLCLSLIYEDIRVEDGELFVTGFDITDFLQNNKGAPEPQLMSSLAVCIEKTKLVRLRLKQIPYVSHSAI